jgi:hydrophobic/amphiphilic exporter-1 (mainly G- bacteria), HAE1 family
VFTSVGGGGGGFGGASANRGSIAVELIPKNQRHRTIFQVIAQLRGMTSAIPEASVSAQVQSPLSGGGGGLDIDVYGPELDQLVAVSNQVAAVAVTVPGISGVRNGGTQDLPELRAVLDRPKMAQLGITAQTIATTMRTMISGTLVSELRPDNQDQLDITVYGSDADRLSLTNVLQVPIATTGGGTVPLGQVATLTPVTSPSQITRTNRQRVISLAAILTDRPVGDVVRDLNVQLAKTTLPPGYHVQLAGSAQQLTVATTALTQALGLSILLIYMLLVALYESWTQPLAVLFSLPLAVVGAFAGLVITGNTLNIFSMIGLIMLMGVVAKNAILLIDYTNTLRNRGLPRREALEQAGPVRLRPIVMTTMTIMFAMLPLALKLEAGAESRAPMAVVVMGGVLSSTLLTLVFVPVMYTYLDDLGEFLNRLARRPAKTPAPVEAAEPNPVGGN